MSVIFQMPSMSLQLSFSSITVNDDGLPPQGAEENFLNVNIGKIDLGHACLVGSIGNTLGIPLC